MRLTPEALRGHPLPRHEGGGGKEERGRVVVVAGSRDVPGAALLAGVAAMRVGAGKLQVFTGRSLAIPLGIAVPEAMVVGLDETEDGAIAPDGAAAVAKAAERAQALLIGPGLVNDAATADLTASLLAATNGIPILLDAAAMMRLDDHRHGLARHEGRVLITPHHGEMAGILGRDKAAIEADPAATAQEVAAAFGIVVALKSACSVVAAPDGTAWTCDHGHPGLGTGGSGDVLAGFVAGLMARGLPALPAALWGVYLHGEAGTRLARSRGPLGFLAREIPGEAPAILADLAAAV